MRFRFEERLYSVNESDDSVGLTIIKDGVIDRSVDLNFETSDGSASIAGEHEQKQISIGEELSFIHSFRAVASFLWFWTHCADTKLSTLF